MRKALLGVAAAFPLLGAPALAESHAERGAYLMQAVVACGNCHTPQTPTGPDWDRELAGGDLLVDDAMMTVYAPNITPASRVAKWSDADLKRAIREGVRPDGTVIGPPMPTLMYRGLSDGDLDAIVSYVRSRPRVEQERPSSIYRFALPPDWGPPVGRVTAPSTSDEHAYGAYIAGPLAHCMECHSTPDAKGVPDVANALGAGGMAFAGRWGASVAPNITPNGIGDWSDVQIEAAIRQGVRPDGRRLLPPMAYAYYAKMSDADMAALIVYLRSLPPR